MAEVELAHVGKTFANGFCALRDLSLTVADGEFLVLVGPSGCGKSTALNLVAGLESCTTGEIRIGGRDVTAEPPKRRDVAMVFQDYALYPHMTVARNIGFPLELAKVAKHEIASRVGEAARILGLEAQLDKRPGQLSGGQKQRVAMGRAIVRRPSVYLMDEPLSNLDAKLRVQMRSEIARIQAELGVTTIYVTHDQVEAMTMGDRVVVMLDGDLQQVDAPNALYARPANLFVAGFIGSPPMNLMRCGVEAASEGLALRIGSSVVALQPVVVDRHPQLRDRVGSEVAVGIRPEHLRPSGHDEVGLDAVVTVVESLGAESLVHLDVDARPVHIADAVADEQAREELGGGIRLGQGARIVARIGPEVGVVKGAHLRVSFDVARLHFFDLADGGSLGND
jgi:multiple sugar transport system ATP-binding protein